MYVIRHFSGARNCDELASNFSCKFLVPVSVTCVAGLTVCLMTTELTPDKMTQVVTWHLHLGSDAPNRVKSKKIDSIQKIKPNQIRMFFIWIRMICYRLTYEYSLITLTPPTPAVSQRCIGQWSTAIVVIHISSSSRHWSLEQHCTKTQGVTRPRSRRRLTCSRWPRRAARRRIGLAFEHEHRPAHDRVHQPTGRHSRTEEYTAEHRHTQTD